MATPRHLIATIIIFFFFSCTSSSATLIKVENKCKETVWPGILPGAGDGLSNGGFELTSGASRTLRPPAGWSGRIWGRTGCHFEATPTGTGSTGNGQACETGDCGGVLQCQGAGGAPPVSLAEFTLLTAQDYYDVSLVDGFNLPLSVVPRHGSGNCTVAGNCKEDVRKTCPAELAVRGNQSGRVVACKSACYAFNSPQYCCTGVDSGPKTCKATEYSRVFKKACPTAYSYAYDDPSSLMTCSRPDYVITFCPAKSSSVTSAAPPSPSAAVWSSPNPSPKAFPSSAFFNVFRYPAAVFCIVLLPLLF